MALAQRTLISLAQCLASHKQNRPAFLFQLFGSCSRNNETLSMLQWSCLWIASRLFLGGLWVWLPGQGTCQIESVDRDTIQNQEGRKEEIFFLQKKFGIFDLIPELSCCLVFHAQIAGVWNVHWALRCKYPVFTTVPNFLEPSKTFLHLCTCWHTKFGRDRAMCSSCDFGKHS